MNKIIIFGASGTGKIAYQFYHERKEVLFWIDNDASKWGK